MAFFTSAYKVLAHLAPNWDSQLRTDMQSLEDNLYEGAFTPGLGGTGASLGSGGAINAFGFASRKGASITYWGQLVFGTGGSWGSGTLVVTGLNIGGNISTSLGEGTGRFYRNASGLMIPLLFQPVTGSTFNPQIVNPNGSPALQSISAPQNGESITFRISGPYA